MPTTNAGATLMLQAMHGAAVAAATKYLALFDGESDRRRRRGVRRWLRQAGPQHRPTPHHRQCSLP